MVWTMVCLIYLCDMCTLWTSSCSFFVSETVLPKNLTFFFFVLSALQTKWTKMNIWVMQVRNHLKFAWKTKEDKMGADEIWVSSNLKAHHFKDWLLCLDLIDCILEMGHSHCFAFMPNVTALLQILVRRISFAPYFLVPMTACPPVWSLFWWLGSLPVQELSTCQSE